MIKITTKKIFSLLILSCLNSCISQKEIHGNLPEAQLAVSSKSKDCNFLAKEIFGIAMQFTADLA